MFRKAIAALVTCVMILSGLTALAGASSSGGPLGTSVQGRGTTPNNDSEPNNDFGNATRNTGNVTYSGGVGMGDSFDFYKIWLNTSTGGGEANHLDVSVTMTQGVTMMKIYDPAQFELLADGPCGFAGTLKLNFTAFSTGYYFIWLKDFGPSNYTITTTITNRPYNPDGDNDFANATNLETGGYPVERTGSLNNVTDIHDFYKVKLNYTADVSSDVLSVYVLVPPLPTTSDFGVELYKAGNATPLKQATINTEGQNESFTFSPDVTGDYYIRVWGPKGNGGYTMTVKKFTGYSDQNDQLDLAAALSETVPHWYNITDALTLGIDQDDYYLISGVITGQTFNCTLTSTGYDPADRTPNMRINMINGSGVDLPLDPADNLADPKAYSNGEAAENGQVYVRLNITEWAGPYDLAVFTNQPPTVAMEIENISFPENTTNRTIKLANVFSDAESDLLSFGYELYGELPNNMTVSVGTDPDLTVTLTPKSGWRGGGWMSWTATDPYGKSVTTVSKTIQVFGVNHKPAVVTPSPAPVILQKNTPDMTSLDMTTIFLDPDGGDKLVYKVTGNQSIRVSFPLDPANNLWPTGAVTFVPVMGFMGIEYMNFTATDNGNPVFTSDPVEIIVEVRDDSPERITVKEIPKLVMVEDTTDGSVVLEGYFNSSAGTDTYTIVHVPVAGSHLNVSVAADSRVTVKPDANWFGTEALKFRGTCSHGMYANATLTVEVTSVNDLPVFVNNTPKDTIINLNEGQSQLFKVTASDAETNASQLKYRWTRDIANVSMLSEYNFITDFDTVPAGETSKTFIIKVTVNDTFTQITMGWNVTVKNVNRAPRDVRVTAPYPGTTYEVGTKVKFVAAGDDDDADTLTFTWSEKTKPLGTGQYFNYTKLGVGKHNITLEVSDGQNTTASSIIVNIKAKPQPGFEIAALMMAAVVGALVLSLRRKEEN